MGQMPGEPLFQEMSRGARLSDRVADHILQVVSSRGLMPGDRLPSERELAGQFGVSRTVIREAIRSLVGKGIVEAHVGLGLRVTAVGVSNVQESVSLFLRGVDGFDYGQVHEVRGMVEVGVAGLAALRATPDDLSALEQSCRDLELADINDIEAAAKADFEFHRLLARAAHNQLCLAMLDAISQPLMGIRWRQLGPGGRNQPALASHREILSLVARHDARGARAAMRSHLADVERAWEQGLGRQPPTS
jgi:GntR family transcriptional repressor for pyruvate dehydrogenase complex